jgi:GNAT superfamily N-acetyltransferase
VAVRTTKEVRYPVSDVSRPSELETRAYSSLAPGSPGRYPSERERDVVLGTGEEFHMRPIRPDDAQRLVAFHQHLSRDSIFRRYFSLHPVLSQEEVAHLTQVDYVDRLALVIVDGDELLAVGRYDRFPGTTNAEVAFVVADQYQHRGLGLALLEHLAEAAWDVGLTTFVAETQADNRYMMSVFEDSGFRVDSSNLDEVIDVRFSIEPTEASRTRRAARRERSLHRQVGP